VFEAGTDGSELAMLARRIYAEDLETAT